MMTNTYVITMRKLSYTLSDEDAYGYFPQVGVSNLSKAEAEARVKELNSTAMRNGWAVDYAMELN